MATEKNPLLKQQFHLDQVVRSCEIGVQPAFIGTVDSVHRSKMGGIFYNILDNDGQLWHRITTELTSVDWEPDEIVTTPTGPANVADGLELLKRGFLHE